MIYWIVILYVLGAVNTFYLVKTLTRAAPEFSMFVGIETFAAFAWPISAVLYLRPKKRSM